TASPPAGRAAAGRAGGGGPRCEVPGHHRLRVARRLPARAGAERGAPLAGVGLVAGAHVDDLLLVEQVVDREPGLQVDAVHRQRPGHVGAQVIDPRHAAEGAALAALVHAILPGPGAVGHAEPAGAAAAALAGVAGHGEVLVRPGHAEGRDRAAGHGAQRAAHAPHLVELVGAAQLDLVAVVVEQVAVAVVVGRVVPVLDHAGVAVVGVGVDRALVVALQLRPQVGRVERPLVVPGAVDLELDRLVGALGIGVADHAVAADRDVTLLGGVDGDPAVLGAAHFGGAPQGQLVARVGDRPQGGVAHAAERVDAHVVQRVGHAAVGGVDAPGPGLVDHGLEAEDRLVLVHGVHVAVHALAVVAHADGELVVLRAALLADDRGHVLGAGHRVDRRRPALEHVEGALVEQAAGEVVADDAGHRHVVAAQVAEQLGGAV